MGHRAGIMNLRYFHESIERNIDERPAVGDEYRQLTGGGALRRSVCIRHPDLNIQYNRYGQEILFREHVYMAIGTAA